MPRRRSPAGARAAARRNDLDADPPRVCSDDVPGASGAATEGVLGFTLKEGDAEGWGHAKLDLPRRFTLWGESGVRDPLAAARLASQVDPTRQRASGGLAVRSQQTWVRCSCGTRLFADRFVSTAWRRGQPSACGMC